MFKHYLELKNFPLFYGPLSESTLKELPKTITLNIGLDTKYDIIRLNIDDDLLSLLDKTYSLGSNPSVPLGVGSIQTKIMNSVLKELELFNNKKEFKVVEVGCGEGYLLNELDKLDWSVKGYEISPTAQKANDTFNIDVVQDYFKYEEGKMYDLVFSYNVLEHIIDLEEFIKDGYKSLEENGVFCHIVPNCDSMLKQGNLRLLSHQHVNYFTPESLMNLFKSFNLHDVQYKIIKPGNALMVFGYKQEQTPQETKVRTTHSADLVELFSNKLSMALDKMNIFLDKALEEGKKVAYYAGGMSEYLILNRKEDVLFVNGDPMMHNKRIFYDLDKIKSPNELLDFKPDIIIVFASNYFDEIKKYIIEEIKIDTKTEIISVDEVIS